ncbi:unnamed protein product [Staurois parvus]|uniref:Uncharacterized protein n=1 Tax=Staurois parvus TaxID=386267 RepID=A0ABN9EPG0_9NEOB|nr:unnamed protein product [Staurois parvus]
MYVKCFDTVILFIYFSKCHCLTFLNFPPVLSPYVLTSQGTEPGRQMPASARGHGRGRCKGDIAGAKGKVSEEEIPEQRCRVFPSVAQGYRLWC